MMTFRDSLKFSLLVLLLNVAITGCGGGGGGGDDDGGDGSGEPPPPPSSSSSGGTSSATFNVGAAADASGVAAASFTLPAFTNKFAVTAEVSGAPLTFISLESDRGVNYLAPDGSPLSLADDTAPLAKAANAPSRDFDPEVLDFATYTARVQTNPGASVNFVVNTRQDPNLFTGNLRVNVFLVGNAAQRSGAARSIDAALARMADILRISGGVVTQVSQTPIDGPDNLPDPSSGDALYRNAAASAASPAVNLFIGADIAVGGGDTLGIAADIPGPPTPTPRSAVAVSLLTSAGPDGRFTDDETRLLGETFAHEISHFMGLFHPVEISGVSVVGTDPLPDTPECSTTVNCLNDDALFRNLMFPFPVPEDEESGTTVPQDQLSTQQRGVLNLYAAVD